MDRRPQFDHADLGLVDDDRTEDLRPMKMPPAGAPTPAEGRQNHSPVTTTD
jgi:hypothetical protein